MNMNMNYADWTRINELAVAQEGRDAVYISNGLNYDKHDLHIWEYIQTEMRKIYSEDKVFDIMTNMIHSGMFFFDSTEERDIFYDILNVRDLTYSSAIYACVYEEDGTLVTENT